MTHSAESLTDKVFNSAALILAANILRQSIGIVSMLILARLLTPTDYGIVAASLLVVNFFAIFSQTGAGLYILRQPALNDTILNTAWTLDLLLRTAFALPVMLLSPWIAGFFDHKALVPVLIACAFIPVIEALASPGLYLLQRDFQYRKISYLDVGSKLVGFVVTVGIALAYRSYWALVIGAITISCVHTVLSYRLHDFRPRLMLHNVRAQWEFSKWSVASAILGYSRAQTDNAIVGRYLGVTDLGVYSLSKQLTSLPHDHLTHALADVFVSGISGDQGRLDMAAQSLSKILVSVVCIMLPCVVGIYIVAEVLVDSLLGPKWNMAIPIIEALAFLTITYSIISTIDTALIAIGRIRRAFVIDLITTLLVIAFMLATLMYTQDPATFGWFRTLIGCVITVIFYIGISQALDMPHRSLLISIIPSMVSASAMYFALEALKPLLENMAPVLQLIVLSLTGALIYAVALFFCIWPMRHSTPELLFISKLTLRLSSRLHVRVTRVMF